MAQPQMNSETLQPGMMTSQPGMMTSQPGMMTQPGMMSSQPGMMASQPGMMTSQPGMMTSQPSMMTSQPGMMGSQLGMMNQPMSNQLAIYNPHHRHPFMGQQFGQPGQVWQQSSSSSHCSSLPPSPHCSSLSLALPAGRPAHAAAGGHGGRGVHADPRGSLPDHSQHVPAATSPSSSTATATAATTIGSGDCHVTAGCDEVSVVITPISHRNLPTPRCYRRPNTRPRR